LKNIGLNIWADSLCPPQTALLSYGYVAPLKFTLFVWNFNLGLKLQIQNYVKHILIRDISV